METSENNLYYCIIVNYTTCPKSEQEKSSYFLVMYTDRNDFPCFCRFLWRLIYRWYWCGLCIKPVNFRVLGFSQSQLFCDYVLSCLYSGVTEVVHLSATSKLKLGPGISMQLSSGIALD